MMTQTTLDFLVWQPVPLAFLWLILNGIDDVLARAVTRKLRALIGAMGETEKPPTTALMRTMSLTRFWCFNVLASLFLFFWSLMVVGKDDDWLLRLVAGALIFTRLSSLGAHLQNALLLRSAARDSALVSNRLIFDPITMTRGASARSLGQAFLLAVACLFSPSSTVAGGALGLFLIACKQFTRVVISGRRALPVTNASA